MYLKENLIHLAKMILVLQKLYGTTCFQMTSFNTLIVRDKSSLTRESVKNFLYTLYVTTVLIQFLYEAPKLNRVMFSEILLLVLGNFIYCLAKVSVHHHRQGFVELWNLFIDFETQHQKRELLPKLDIIFLLM